MNQGGCPGARLNSQFLKDLVRADHLVTNEHTHTPPSRAALPSVLLLDTMPHTERKAA